MRNDLFCTIILALVDSDSAVALIGLDISAAFDTVSHPKLLARLETEFGIEGAALGWINSYLSNRTFFCPRRGQLVGCSRAVVRRATGIGSWTDPFYSIRCAYQQTD